MGEEQKSKDFGDSKSKFWASCFKSKFMGLVNFGFMKFWNF